MELVNRQSRIAQAGVGTDIRHAAIITAEEEERLWVIG